MRYAICDLRRSSSVLSVWLGPHSSHGPAAEFRTYFPRVLLEQDYFWDGHTVHKRKSKVR